VERGRVAILREYGQPIELEEFEVPAPGPGAMIVRIEQAGICGSDLNIMRGVSPLNPGGRALGHEGFGSVFRLGAGVTTDSLGRPLREGDRIIHSGVEPCYRCHACLSGEFAWCPSYSPSSRVPGQFPYFLGTYADYLYLEAGRPVFKIPDGIPDSVLTFVNCALGTVTDPLLRIGVDPGKTVVVQGAGGLGLNAVAMLKLLGARRIIVLDRQPGRLDLARRMGAAHTVNIDEFPEAADRAARIRELTGGRGADIVMELVGHPALMEEGVGMLASGGTFVQVGLTMADAQARISPVSLLRGKTIMGSIMYRPHVLPMLLDILSRQDGEIPPFDHIVSRTYPLSEINEALADMEWRSKAVEPARASIVPD
jgi:D-arabinose 1-dehydrogenase-like Zn-dependent alcohol dehydrogenase